MGTTEGGRTDTNDPHARLADAWKKFVEQVAAIRSMTEAISRDMKTNKPRGTNT